MINKRIKQNYNYNLYIKIKYHKVKFNLFNQIFAAIFLALKIKIRNKKIKIYNNCQIYKKLKKDDSDQFFIYENKKQNKLFIQNDQVCQNQKRTQNIIPIFDITKQKKDLKSKFIIKSVNHSINDTQNYLISKFIRQNDQTTNQYQILKLDDKIRFGRIQYCVTQIKNNIQNFKIISEIIDIPKINKFISSALQKNPICKICFSQLNQQYNMLIAPCQCKGSCKYVHINCLKKWINNRIVVKRSGFCKTYSCNKFSCQVCKFPYHRLIQSQNGIVQLLSIQKPQNKPYIVLESTNQQNENERTIHIISMLDKQKIVIGRGKQCQINIGDISVSRQHAQIRLINGRFVLKDKCSRFGTSIKVRGDIILRQQLHIQNRQNTFSFRHLNINN